MSDGVITYSFEYDELILRRHTPEVNCQFKASNEDLGGATEQRAPFDPA